ncbi:hypothetical protein PHYSODRAFT_257340 [Phytophthora sojae]|uniref:Uncharacterized protein n=1 Tax=Phytophthora sojae (strain P6497) TaxID=1094619 RepID=G4YLW2_PHYSP|nr:hypothetical protein PHYSODRAFT_257340 [Phytophthora sojae]EGZ27157.1 hypothetical protein PHYSODRAFT_257340 [Phytophthora sojae]|eukprot:XP_009514432.1 hypothetical protein PHYSODRAFT_257340 [Phytophthora sojae]
MQSSGGPGSAPPFTFPDLGPVVQDAQLRGPTGQVIDSLAPASEASVVPTPALPSASGASSDPACTQLVLRSSPDSSPLHEPSSNAAHFCRTGSLVPRGMTVREVATAITVNPVLDPRRATAPWVREFTNFHGSPFGLQEDGQPGEDEISEAEEVEELIEEIESPVAEESSEEVQDESRRAVDAQEISGEATQALGAHNAATATQDSVQDRVAASEAPVEEAPASETPADAPRSPPSAADQSAAQAEVSPAARLRDFGQGCLVFGRLSLVPVLHRSFMFRSS